jgi:hypothetical protein
MAVTEEDIIAFCKGEIAGFKVPKKVDIKIRFLGHRLERQ